MENVPQRTQRTRRKFGRDVMDSLFTLFCIPLRSSASSAVRFPPVVRSGISLLEVLIAIFVLSIGLLGIAALIPLGKLAMMETEKSDRTGACGRAALRDVKVRRMLEPTGWCNVPAPVPNIFVIDPLYYAANTVFQDTDLAPNLGGVIQSATLPVVPRFTFVPLMLLSTDNAATVQAKQFQAEQIHFWQDELLFDLPEDRNPVPVGAGDRPLPVEVGGVAQRNANFSWFLTVAPLITEAALPINQRRLYSVSVVVCHKRVLTQTPFAGGVYEPDGETYYPARCDNAIGYGGIGVTLQGNALTGAPPIENGEWILLYGIDQTTNMITQATWYRVVHAGFDGTNTRATLVGPDWHGGGNVTMGDAIAIVVGGVTGVYTTTVQLDSDLIWSQ